MSRDDETRPPWIASNQTDRQWMCNWVIAKLEVLDEEQSDQKMKLLADPNVQAHVRGLVERQLTELRSKERAIAEADCGNMQPLQETPSRICSIL
jgi:hypothetical protein